MGFWAVFGHVMLILLIVLAAFFVLTFLIFIFNLDMKMSAKIYTFLNKVHDKKDVKRDLKF